MRAGLDSIFKVGFGVDLNCLVGSNKEGIELMEAFDEANALIYWRYVDPLWRLKRYFNFGAEAALRKNIKIIDAFVNRLISMKRELLAEQRGYVSDSVKTDENKLSSLSRDLQLSYTICDLCLKTFAR